MKAAHLLLAAPALSARPALAQARLNQAPERKRPAVLYSETAQRT